MPVGGTDEPTPMPSGEVALRVGVGLAIPLTCAMATLQAKSAGRAAAINENLTCILRFAAIAPDARLSDIGQSLRASHEGWKNQQRQMLSFLSSVASDFCCSASNVESRLCSASLAGECGRKSLARG